MCGQVKTEIKPAAPEFQVGYTVEFMEDYGQRPRIFRGTRGVVDSIEGSDRGERLIGVEMDNGDIRYVFDRRLKVITGADNDITGLGYTVPNLTIRLLDDITEQALLNRPEFRQAVIGYANGNLLADDLDLAKAVLEGNRKDAREAAERYLRKAGNIVISKERAARFGKDVGEVLAAL